MPADHADEATGGRARARRSQTVDVNGAALPLPDSLGSQGTAPANEIVALGLRFHPMTKADLVDEIFRPRPEGEQAIIAGANLHGLYVTHVDPDYDALLGRPQTRVIVDGMPVIWLLKALGHKVTRDHRTTWVDWLTDAMDRAAASGRTIFILGHNDEVLAAGIERARRRWPALRIEGHSGFFDMSEGSAACDDVIGRINAVRPDFLVVGMGMPRQEVFVQRYADRIDCPVIGLGGAAFAYFAGFEPTPPRWMGRWGLEWLHRLASDPRRMAKRYLVEPVLLSYHLGRRALRSR